MRIAFDARPAPLGRGIGRYTSCLRDALRDAGHELTETHRPPRSAPVFHSPWIDGAPLRPRVPTAVTLHDLVPLKRRGEYLRTGARFRLRYLAVGRADAIIVPTRAVAEDAERMLDLAPERLHVIGEAAAAVFRPRPAEEVEAARARLGLPEDYLLWVGGLRHPDPRKRVAELVRAPRKLPLVLAGATGPWTSSLEGAILTGGLPDDELAAVYSGARALVFSSDEEGFGLPPVEALACGTPVAVSDGRVAREVLDGRATLVDPDDLAGLVAAGERLERPAPAALPRTWGDVATETVRVYERIASPDPG